MAARMAPPGLVARWVAWPGPAVRTPRSEDPEALEQVRAGDLGGSGGSGGSDAGGDSGADAGGCSVASECAVDFAVTPSGCAEAYCDNSTCKVRSVDGDGDGHRAANCTAVDAGAGTVLTGDDCDDEAPDTYPCAWDGPADTTHADRCNEMSQDCDQGADDDCLPDGTTAFARQVTRSRVARRPGGKRLPTPSWIPRGTRWGSAVWARELANPTGSTVRASGQCHPTRRSTATEARTMTVTAWRTWPTPTRRVLTATHSSGPCDGLADMADTDTPPLGMTEWA